jgi:anaerobic ribonucleoside-triphosphate reductase
MSDKKIPVECWTRVVGFFRPTNQFNNGKKQEWSERHLYNPEEIE